MLGETFSSENEYDLLLVKTNEIGDTMWTRTIGSYYREEGFSVQQTLDGGYILAGVTGSNWNDVYLVKTDETGDTVWTKTYGGDNDDRGRSVQITTEGGYIVTGWTIIWGWLV